jgi:hypothetical protein
LYLGSPAVSGATYLWSHGATTNPAAITQSGTYWLQVTAPNGCTASDTIVVTMIVQAETPRETPYITLSPNPFSESARIIIHEPPHDTVSLRLYDVHGKLQLERPMDHNIPTIEIGETLKSGIYFLVMEGSQMQVSYKLVKL